MNKPGESDLGRLLADLRPALADERYTFEATDRAVLDPGIFALVREKEGLTAIRADPAGEWARISLEVHSSLEAVGLTSAISAILAGAGISANVVAALHHDHIFVQWSRREDALRALNSLA
ncbi:ACT domain-containing protein [Sphingomonas alba]|uniref:ACT domain-containing protein n=1 Tax=Sphingomonas alba TaxID=2908208 RepID=A0ABT0RPE8_9SPHN|nr:ACT domain-containing protein [Sphingomonas alba]MCL6684531.1 ACT domain-containing protein [Sphingomonas alba]